MVRNLCSGVPEAITKGNGFLSYTFSANYWKPNIEHHIDHLYTYIELSTIVNKSKSYKHYLSNVKETMIHFQPCHKDTKRTAPSNITCV